MSKSQKAASKSHGGARAGAGRKPAPRPAGKALRTVYCWLTPYEHDAVNRTLDATERASVLITASKERMVTKRQYEQARKQLEQAQKDAAKAQREMDQKALDAASEKGAAALAIIAEYKGQQ